MTCGWERAHLQAEYRKKAHGSLQGDKPGAMASHMHQEHGEWGAALDQGNGGAAQVSQPHQQQVKH